MKKFNFYNRASVWFSVVLMMTVLNSCEMTPTSDILEGDVIPDSAYSYQITTLSSIEHGESFFVEIEAFVGTNPAISYTGPATVSLLGAGQLSGNQTLSFSGGVASTSLVYSNPAATPGSSSIVYLKVTDDNRPNITATSDPIQVGLPSFSVSPSPQVEEGQPFLVTIQAILNNASYTGYFGTVDLGVSGNGSLTILSGPAQFNGGSATVLARYDSPALAPGATEPFYIIATDSLDSSKTGLSSSVSAGKPGFEIVAPTAIQTGIPFNVTIRAILHGAINTTYLKALSEIGLTENGNGSLSILSTPTYFLSGQATLTVVYNDPALASGSTSLVSITATDLARSEITANGDAMVVSVPVSLDHFEVSVPITIYQNEPFSVTITAIGTDFRTFAPYASASQVTLTTSTADGLTGNLSAATGTGFVNGVLTINNLTYDAVASGLKIHVTDTTDNSKTGMSRAITVFGSTLSVSATPVDTDANGVMDAAKIFFSVPVGTFYYKIWKGSNLLGTVFVSSATYFLETGLAESAVPYEYVVEAYNSTNTLLKSASVSVLLKPCTVISAGVGDAITSSAIWTKAASPYCINSSVTVSGAGTVLTVEPGASLLFADAIILKVNAGAAIQAAGTAAEPIVFTSAKANPVPGSWGGVVVESTALANNISVVKNGNEVISEIMGNQGSVFKFTSFSYAKHGIVASVPIWVEYSQFMKNFASYLNSPTYTGHGAGIRIIGSNYSVVRNSMFIQNEGWDYGNNPADIDIRDPNAGAVIRNNIFYNSRCSSANSGGGSLGIGSTSVVSTIYGNTFYKTGGNGSGGAIYITSSTNNIIRKNIFQETYAAASGGAIEISNGVSGHKILENTFIGTRGNGGNGSDGGAIHISGSGGDLIQDNTFDGTYASAGFYPASGGAISLNGGSGTIIHNNYFKNTRAVGTANGIYGGAISLFGITGGPTIMNNTFDGTYVNKTTSSAGLPAYGGAIYIENSASWGFTVNSNYFSGTYANATSPNNGKGGSVAIIGAGLNSLALAGNSCKGAYVMTAATPSCLYTQEDGAYTVTGWWWADLAGAPLIPANPLLCTTGLCETTVSGTPAISGTLTSPPVLCCANPNASGCVGATILPAGAVCQ